MFPIEGEDNKINGCSVVNGQAEKTDQKQGTVLLSSREDGGLEKKKPKNTEVNKRSEESLFCENKKELN